jgi:transposase
LRGWSYEHDEEVFTGRRERAVRLVFEHEAEHESQWAAIESIAAKMGCTAETLRKWVRQAERDQGRRAGVTSTERERLKELERENRELKRANEILRKASAFFAQAELDRRPK